ncbi:hypothetical protein PHMEG_00023032 [Phytophthora megakarya]|uniref:Reverse transcriptase n=1 Tax=Phytophthora megakarya TaxID=4795 RepID=A0A225VJB0_9STRA|nr:hypothetical protein PHMEG_00023032 [Phytophthora megakarya]
MGAVDDARMKIYVISAGYPKRQRLREVLDHGRSLEVRGINPGVLETRRWALVKITLGWERVCEFPSQEITYISVTQEIEAEIASGARGEDNDLHEHILNEVELADYAHEQAFLPDLTEPSSSVFDYTGPNVVNEGLSGDRQQKLVEVLKRHEKIMIASGNALPPPAYSVVCDIDVHGHAPIKQRKRPWASPIVVVLKKNGIDIRVCIIYKHVNAVTTIMEYAKPLVDDLLTDMEAYLWFCSLDEAIGFWEVMMTERARKGLVFLCALGHFEWRRMPFRLNMHL